MFGAWDNWWHVTGCTYGCWPRGDPRGWRARHHREHVDGDYQNPPPAGKYEKINALSRRLMKRDRVVLTNEQRAVACRALAESLVSDGVEVVDLCVGAKHYHMLVRFDPLNSVKPRDRKRTPRWLIGRAKGRSARLLSKMNLIDIGGVWAKRCRTKPVKDRRHQVNIARYILAHGKKGCVVWSALKRRKP